MHLKSPWALHHKDGCSRPLYVCIYVGLSAVVQQRDVLDDYSHTVYLVSDWKARLNTEQRKDQITGVICFILISPSPYLDLDGPWEVTDVDIKGNIGVASKGELLTGETVSVFLDVGFRHDGHLLPWDGSSCWGKEFVFSTLTFGRSPPCRDGAALAETYYYESINGSIKPFGTTRELS